jgi:hypothetical protein
VKSNSLSVTSRSDYLDRIAEVHAEIDKLLASPKSEWPKREDGKLNMLQDRFDRAEAEAATTPSDETAKTVAETKAELDNYRNLLRQGGY